MHYFKTIVTYPYIFANEVSVQFYATYGDPYTVSAG